MDALESFLEYLEVERGVSENTLAAYHTDLVQFRTFLREARRFQRWADVKREDMIAFLLFMKERKYAPSTVTRRISAIRSFFAFMIREGKLARDPSEGVELPSVSRHLPRVLSTEEVDDLLELPGRANSPIALRWLTPPACG